MGRSKYFKNLDVYGIKIRINRQKYEHISLGLLLTKRIRLYIFANLLYHALKVRTIGWSLEDNSVFQDFHWRYLTQNVFGREFFKSTTLETIRNITIFSISHRNS